MSDKDPVWWQAVISHIAQYPIAWFVGGSAFFSALWAGMMDGHSLARSAFGGLICVIIVMALVLIVQLSGFFQLWMAFVGIFVGFIGAERIRDAILVAWDSRKKRMLEGQHHDDQM
ncbi:phage holin family protein [Enterobacter mori]|uniref:phage holin family protein n=1 Tax=Enterobacter mori TaxID=539813 RepID=UPI003B83DDE9